MEQHSPTSTHQDNAHFDAQLIANIKDGTRNEQVISYIKETNISNARNKSGNTLLHIAAQYRNDVITRHLVHSGFSIDIQNNSGKTPLIVAIQNRCQKSTRILLEANANTLISDSENKSALHYFQYRASTFENFYLTRTFLKNVERQCLNNTEVIATKLIDASWSFPCVILLENVEVTEAMLKRGCEVDARQPSIDFTSLHWAVLSKKVALVKVLLDYGADPNAVDKYHRAPLHYVYGRQLIHTNEQLEIVKLLIAKGALTLIKIGKSSWSQVDTVLRYGNCEAIQFLLDANLDLTTGGENGNTPLHILAMNKTSDVFKVLNDKNFNVNACNLDWQTPLLIAAAHGNACAVDFLLKKGAKVNAAYNENSSPIHTCIKRASPALENQYMKCIQLLLEYGAKFQRKFYIDRERTTVFDVVEKRQIYGVGELLIAHLVLLEAREIPIKISILRRIQSHSTFEKYYDFCKQQLAVKMFKSVTLLDLLSVSDDKFESYARDQQCASGIDNFDKEWKLKLCYYNTILQRKYSKAVQMLKLRKEAAIHICEIMKTDYFRFPLIADQIVNYLDETDLRNLLQVSL